MQWGLEQDNGESTRIREGTNQKFTTLSYVGDISIMMLSILDGLGSAILHLHTNPGLPRLGISRLRLVPQHSA